ncbi:SpaA isopeptide-forming pilin-related protein, partial [Leucobacter luti]|uniref:SpaA isopeptide-forming pilin-related protein n=1 Tax=Leucobacter luti TaxID=340320 RepID=UPI0024110DAC
MPSAYPGDFSAPKTRGGGLRPLLAGLLTALLVVMGFSASPAMAAAGTVEIVLPGGSGSHNGQPVFEEGQSYTLEIRYDRGQVPGGHVAEIAVPKGFTITEAPASNTAVEKFELVDGVLRITFKDPITVANGAIELNFTVDTVVESSQETVNWSVNGEETSQLIVVKKRGDEFTTLQSGSSKSAGGVTWPAVVITEAGRVELNPDSIAKEIPYTVTVNSKDARAVSITDTLGTGLTLVPGSFSMKKTWWDANGLNKQTATEALAGYTGQSFTHEFDAEQNSSYVLTYRAKIADAAALEVLRTELQAKYDLVKDQEGKVYEIALTNTAVVNGAEHRTESKISGRTPTDPSPNLGAAFAKTSDLVQNTPITLAEDGVTLAPAVPVTYTLKADLTQFSKFVGTKHELTRNVVITDALPANLRWLVGEQDFVAGYRLVTGVSEADFAGDAYVGAYMVDGQNLRINVGKDLTKTHQVKVKAELLSVANATRTEEPGDNPYAQTLFSGITNVAKFFYNTGGGYDRSTEHRVVISKDPKNGIDDQGKFKKRTDSKPIVLDEGETVAEIPFTFTVGSGIGDAATSTIIDHIDHSVLDVSEATLAQIKASITGAYDSNFPIDGTTLELSLNENNDLVFTPNAAFPLKSTWGSAAATPLKQAFTFTVKIPTKPITGKEAITVKNSATYLGADNETVFTSKTTSSAGVGGREIDILKTVYNADKQAFTTNLRAEVDADGALVQDEYVYRVQFISTLGYTKMLFDIKDQLAENLEFVGFVNPDQVGTDGTAGTGEYRIPGTELKAKYSSADHRITIEKNQTIPGGKITELFFKVRITDFTYGEGVENVIGSERVTITPTNDFPLDISKLNELDPTGTPITDRDARFELRNSAGETVLSDLYVVGGKLRIAGESGGDAVPTVKTAGTYTVHETKAPAGYVLDREPIALIVDEDGTSPETKFLNTPRSAVKKVSVGDYVWLDVDRDGVQGTSPDEKPIQGVKLVLTGPDGNPVTDVFGNPVEPVVTDEDGFYEFIDLPALQPGETYTVSIDREDEGTLAALEGLIPTKTEAGDDRATDSSEWVAVSRDDLVN